MGHGERSNPFSRANRADGIIDARGRKLEVGDEVMLNLSGPIFLRVVDIRPYLHPQAPAGMLQIEVAVGLHFFAPQGIPQREFIRVRTAEEAGPTNVVKLDEPAGDEPKVVEP